MIKNTVKNMQPTFTTRAKSISIMRKECSLFHKMFFDVWDLIPEKIENETLMIHITITQCWSQ